MSGKRRQSKSNRRNKLIRLTYAASILVLTALIGGAFFGPGWVFGFQDGRQCSDTVLRERENADVAVLSTNYESSFYQRMVNYAESRLEGRNYYVASEELTDYSKLTEFLYSEKGLYSEYIWNLISIRLITQEIFQCQVSEWKQYVIYSDDYTQGVNFILWYIELEHLDEDIGTYRLLVEADTGELYGLKADTGGSYFEGEISYDRNYIYYDYSLEDYLGFSTRENYHEAWRVLAYIYSGLTGSDFWELYELYIGAVEEVYGKKIADRDITNVAINSEEVQEEIRLKMGITDEENQWLNFLTTYPEILIRDGGNRLECNFPYGEGSLVFRLQMAESVPHPWILRNITIGFPAIYELIPGFE